MATKDRYQVAVVNEIDLSKTGVTFAASATTSSVLTCGGTTPTGLFLPSSWTSCNLSFYVCKTPGGTFLPMTNFDGSAFAIATTASNFIPLQPAMFNSVLFLQLVASVAQVSALTVDLALSPIFQGIHA